MNARTRITLGAACLVAASNVALAFDGTETLGTPSIAYEESGDVLLTGIGLVESQPGTFEIFVPEGRVVRQVVAYWDGLDEPGLTQGETDTIDLNGNAVTGDRISDPINIVGQFWVSGYRADVTDLGLVGEGANLITASGLDYTYANDGVAFVVVLENEARGLTVRDGVDYAYRGFSEPLQSTEPVIYSLEPSDEAREATVSLLVGGVASERPSVIEIWVDDVLVREEIDLLGNNLGAELDAVSLDITVPADASEVRVQLISEDRGGPLTGLLEASMTWLFASLSIDQDVDEVFYGCDPHFWLCNWWRWDPWCTDDNVTDLDFKDRFNDTFDVSPWRSGLWNHKSLGSALAGGGWCNYWLRMLNREAVAALLNADAVNYPYSRAEVIALYRDAVGEEQAGKSFWDVFCIFYEANRLGCPEEF